MQESQPGRWRHLLRLREKVQRVLIAEGFAVFRMRTRAFGVMISRSVVWRVALTYNTLGNTLTAVWPESRIVGWLCSPREPDIDWSCVDRLHKLNSKTCYFEFGKGVDLERLCRILDIKTERLRICAGCGHLLMARALDVPLNVSCSQCLSRAHPPKTRALVSATSIKRRRRGGFLDRVNAKIKKP